MHAIINVWMKIRGNREKKTMNSAQGIETRKRYKPLESNRHHKKKMLGISLMSVVTKFKKSHPKYVIYV